MIKLIIFDLDGVLVDAKDLHYEALNRALAFIPAWAGDPPGWCAGDVGPTHRGPHGAQVLRTKSAGNGGMTLS